MAVHTPPFGSGPGATAIPLPASALSHADTISESEKDLSPGSPSSGSSTPSISGKPFPPVAGRTSPYEVRYGPVTDWVYHHLWIKRRRVEDLDDVATQESVFDGPQAEFYQPRADWEVGLLPSVLT